MKKYAVMLVAFILSNMLFGCSSVGTAPADNPPQMVSFATNPKDNKEVKVRMWNGSTMRETGWDKPAAFGPVPTNLQATGDALCKQAQYQRAIGYHPQAKDLTGQPILGGGYLCSGNSAQ